VAQLDLPSFEVFFTQLQNKLWVSLSNESEWWKFINMPLNKNRVKHYYFPHRLGWSNHSLYYIHYNIHFCPPPPQSGAGDMEMSKMATIMAAMAAIFKSHLSLSHSSGRKSSKYKFSLKS
jgi:hypothetical protein